MEFVYSDGGRSKYFQASRVGDCVTRAICNATGKDYKEVYDRLKHLEKTLTVGKREKQGSVRDGTRKKVLKHYIEKELGWVSVPCMTIGSGCTTHVSSNELPNKGTYILNLSKHLSCLKDGVLYDTYNCSRGENRCVYGYWREPTQEELSRKSDYERQVQEYKDFVQREKEELSVKRLEVKKYNDNIKKLYAPRINKLKAQLRKLEKEMNAKMQELPKHEKDGWAKKGLIG